MATRNETETTLLASIKSSVEALNRSAVLPEPRSEALLNYAKAYRAVVGGDQPG